MKSRPARRPPPRPAPHWIRALALCGLGIAACNAPDHPSDSAIGEIAPVERQVTLHIDPQAGRIESVQARAVLTRIASDLALDFEVADLRQNGDQTTFQLRVRNRGSALSDLRVRLGADRATPVGLDTLQLGNLASTGEKNSELTFDNPDRRDFTLTLNLWAMFDAAGAPASPASASPSVDAASPATEGEASPPSPDTLPLPSGLPTAAATPLAPAAANPGPNAARGRILLNGRGAPGLKLALIRTPGWAQQTVVTDAEGTVTARELEPGDYQLYYYNDSDRNKVGYWRSRPQRVDGQTGAVFPTIDLYQLGMKNEPPMDARRTLPLTFQWVPQTQTVEFYRFRLHSAGGRTFTLVHQSDKLPGDSTSFRWDGAGAELNAKNRYFWGLFWDAGPLGEGGNLYQAIYLSR